MKCHPENCNTDIAKEETVERSGNFSYTTNTMIRGHPNLIQGSGATDTKYGDWTIFPAIFDTQGEPEFASAPQVQVQRKTFQLHDIVRATAAEATENSDSTNARYLQEAAHCFEEIAIHGPRWAIPEPSISADAELKHVLLLGKTGNGKSIMGNVLIDRYRDGFRVSQNMSSMTQVTQTIKNDKRKVVVYDTKGFFDNNGLSKFYDLDKNHQKMKLAMEIKDLCLEVAKSGGIDCVALAVKKTRCDANDLLFVEFALKELFRKDLGDRLFIVVTFAENICEDYKEQLDWINQNANDGDKLFSSYFDLVKKDKERVVFVDNKDPNSCKS